MYPIDLGELVRLDCAAPIRSGCADQLGCYELDAFTCASSEQMEDTALINGSVVVERVDQRRTGGGGSDG